MLIYKPQPLSRQRLLITYGLAIHLCQQDTRCYTHYMLTERFWRKYFKVYDILKLTI